MKTIFQTGFRPANPFEMGFNPFGAFRLGQDDEGWTSESEYTWPEEVPYPTTTYEQPPFQQPAYTFEPTQSEEDEWRSLQQHTTTSTVKPKKELSPLEAIAKGVVTGGTAAAEAYVKAEKEKAKAAQTAARGTTTVPYGTTPIAPGTVAGIPSTTLLVGIGALALVTIVAVSVA